MNEQRRSPRTARDLRTPVILIGFIGLVGLLTMVVADAVSTRVVQLALINLVMVVGLFTYSGLTGTLSFGHVSFMAVGAYTCAYLTIPTGVKQSAFPDFPGALHWLLDIQVAYLPSVVLSGLVAAAFALVLAPVFVRLSALQGAIATLALLMIVNSVLTNWTGLTRGQSSMIGIPADLTIAGATCAALLVVAVVWGFRSSKVGLRLRASRDDEVAAVSVGMSLGFDRTLAWVLSAFVAGIAGALYAHFVTSFTPDQFFLTTTFVIIAMLVVGGMRTLTGAVVGTAVYSVAAELLRRLTAGDVTGVSLPPGTAEVLLAALLLLILIKRPRGIAGGTGEIGSTFSSEGKRSG